MLAIALATFREALKKKIILLIGLLTAIYLVLLAILIFFVDQDARKYSNDSMSVFINIAEIVSIIGFYFSSMLTAFLTIMASIGAVSSDIESGVIHSIISRPLPRREFVFGKFLGLGILLTVYSFLLYTSIVLIPAAMHIPSAYNMGLLPLLKGLGLFILEPVTVLSLCIFGSVYFKTLNNGIFVGAIYILGLAGGMLEQIGSLLKNKTLANWGIVSSLISPFDAIYRKMISVIFSPVGLSNPFGPSSIAGTAPSTWMIVYTVIFLLFFLLLAVRKFNVKDIS